MTSLALPEPSHSLPSIITTTTTVYSRLRSLALTSPRALATWPGPRGMRLLPAPQTAAALLFELRVGRAVGCCWSDEEEVVGWFSSSCVEGCR